MTRKKRLTTRPGRPFKPGNPGRPKGALNKFTSLKKSFLDVYERIGGDDSLEEFARNHKVMFYQMLTKLFPQEVDYSGEVKTGGELVIKVVYTKNGDGGNGNGDKGK